MSKIINIAGYKFIELVDLNLLRVNFLEKSLALNLKGTILLSHEGINITLAGTEIAVESFLNYLKEDNFFADIVFKKSISTTQPFKRMKVKLKKEIITLRHPEIQPAVNRAPAITPQQLKQWLDEKRDFILVDTRNKYEIEYGTFQNAVNLELNDFSELPDASEKLDSTKPVVMFCTGGIRCEKAALHFLNKGFSETYQLDGGILNYFEQVGSAHYQGACFVFDERVVIHAPVIDEA